MLERRHFAEIDLLKAVAIVCVVVIHSSRPFAHAGPFVAEKAIALMTQFAVPCFLLCSGFLYATRAPVPLRTLGARLGWLVIPYLIAAVLAGLYRERVLGHDVVWLRDLPLGHTFGIYYYVFVIVSLTLVTPLIPWLPAPLRWLLTAFLVASGSLRSLAPLLELTPQDGARLNAGLDPSFPWHLRHPLLVWGYFFVGWELRLYGAGVLEGARARPWVRRAALVPWAGLSLLVVYWSHRGENLALSVAAWPLIWASLLALILVAFGSPPAAPATGAMSRARDWLSRHTYFIYLYHFFFVLAAQARWPRPPGQAAYGLFGWYVLLALAGPGVLAVLLGRLAPPGLQRAVGLGRGHAPPRNLPGGHP